MRRRGASLLFAAATAAALSPPNRSARKAPLRQATSTLSGGVLRAYDSFEEAAVAHENGSSGAPRRRLGTPRTDDRRQHLRPAAHFGVCGHQVFYFAPLPHLWYKALHKLEKSGVSSGDSRGGKL